VLNIGGSKQVLLGLLHVASVNHDRLDVLAHFKLGQHLGRIVVKELMDWRELLRDCLDALLSNHAPDEGAQRVEDSLALEGKQVEQPYHLRVILQVIVGELALLR